jgi:uncharacterized membrane protein
MMPDRLHEDRMGTTTRTAPPTYSAAAPDTPHRAFGRIASIDIVRGAVMVLMAIDHVRVYAGVPAGGPTAGVFFTRWITNFCAPGFFLLAGASAFLYGAKVRSRTTLARFLLTRGLWFVALELTVLRFGWTFNFDYAQYTLAGVLWALGWSMVVLAGLVFLPTTVVTALGVVVIVGHNAVGGLLFGIEDPSWLLRVLYVGGTIDVLGVQLQVLYSLVPWVGVMAAGYGLGALMQRPAPQRDRTLVILGSAAIALFVLLRATGVYGDPRAIQGPPMPYALAFLNTAKYPASLLFLLMTLGPVLLVLPLLEGARGRVARWLETFGRVPFFYYVLHIPLIHAVAVLISLARTPQHTGWLFANHPVQPPPVPDGYRWGLPLLYAVTAIIVVALYFPSRWYAKRRAERPARWMSYL